MEPTLTDLRYAIRLLVKKPGFALVAIVTLALGIGASTAIFTVVNGVLLRPLPYPNPDQLVQVWQIGDRGQQMMVSDPNFEDLSTQSVSFEALAQYSSMTASVTGADEPARSHVAFASRGFFQILGVQPMLGRVFLSEEHREGAPPAVIVSHGFWQRYLGGDTELSRKELTVGNQVHQVVGVMPRGVSFPPGAELWIQRELRPRLPSRTAHNWRVIGRLKDGVRVEQADQELSVIAGRLKQDHGQDTWMVDAAVIPLHEQMVGRARPVLLLLFGAVGFLLLVACANVVNLLLAEAASRQREIAVRAAIGASRWRLARQFLVEAVVLALAGGALGVAVAYWGVNGLLAFESGRLPRTEDIGVDYGVLAFTFALSVVTAVPLGLIAAWRSTGANLQEWLKSGGQRQGASRSGRRLRSLLVVSQMALTLVLLAGASLMGRSFLRLMAVDLGFRTDKLMTMHLAHPAPEGDQGKARLAGLYESLMERLRAIPGVTEVGGVNSFPMSGGQANGQFLIMYPGESFTSLEDFRRVASDPQRLGYAEFRIADEGYFRAMGIPLVRGRLFDERDGRDTPHVAVISATLARERWPGEDVIGKLIQFGNMDGDLRPFTIVGIVEDVREHGIDAEPRPTFYGCYRQRPTASCTVVLFGPAEMDAMVSAARGVLREVNPDLPPRFRSVKEIVVTSIADRRFNLLLLGAFGGVALLLAVMGIYGVTANSVTQRTREIGVRLALGATPGQVFRMVVGSGLMPAAVGVAIGVAGALGLVRLLSSFLFGISARDPVSFASVAALLVIVAGLACYLPARRAMRVDPMVALRYE